MEFSPQQNFILFNFLYSRIKVMRPIWTLVFSLLVFFENKGYSQTIDKTNRFFIKGKIIGRDTGMIVLWYNDKDNKVCIDTTILRNGRFRFSGTANRVCEALLWVDPKMKDIDNSSMIRFLLEPKSITIIGKKDHEAKAAIKGSWTEIEKERWDKKKSWLLIRKARNIEKFDSLLKIPKNNRDITFEERANHLSSQRDSLNGSIKAVDLGYIKRHPNSYLSAYLLSKHVRKLSVDSIQFLYTSLSNEVKKSSVARDVLAYVYPLTDDNEFRKINTLIDAKFDERLSSIKSIYDLDLKDTLGNDIYLGSFKGKYLVIDFWGSTCKPCIENIPSLNELIKTYKPNSFQIVSVSIDKDADDWKAAIRKYHFDGLQVSDLQGFTGLAAVYCKALWVPRYVIADKSGKIINYDAPHPKTPEFKTLLNSLIR